MPAIIDNPLAIFAAAFAAQAIAAWLGALLVKRQLLSAQVHKDFELIKASTLTLLALIIGFSFSMALNRYDQRKNYEEAEANAIGTEYVRADLLPAADAAKVRLLLRGYLKQRMLFYAAADERELDRINTETARLQMELWRAILPQAAAKPTPVVALVVAGMNDVLNSQGYTQAAWWNRIPRAAWWMMFAIALCANLLCGVGASRAGAESILLLVLPLVIAIALLLIADIDSPRGGFILVRPQNLESLVQSLGAP